MREVCVDFRRMNCDDGLIKEKRKLNCTKIFFMDVVNYSHYYPQMHFIVHF